MPKPKVGTPVNLSRKRVRAFPPGHVFRPVRPTSRRST